MQAIVQTILMGGRKFLTAFFVGSLLLAGNAVADAKKGVPTKLEPPKRVEVPQAPPAAPPKVAAPPQVTRKCWPVNQSSAMPVEGGQYLPSLYLQSCCPGCGPLHVSSLFIQPSGGMTSQLQYEICE